MKVNPEHLRWLILFPLQALLLFLLHQLNFTLGEYGVFLFFTGALITYPCAFFPMGQAVANLFCLTFFYEAAYSWTPGSLFIPSIIVLMGMVYLRRRLHYYQGPFFYWVSLTVNAGLFLLLTIKAGDRFPMDSSFWLGNLGNLLISSIFVFVLLKWILAIHNAWLGIFNIRPLVAIRAQR